MEHNQTVECPWKGTPGWWTTVWCASTNFKLWIVILKQHQNCKISYFHKFYKSFQKNKLFLKSPNIPKNHPKINKTAQNIDMWDEQRDSWLSKHKRDICTKSVIPSQNTTFMLTPFEHKLTHVPVVMFICILCIRKDYGYPFGQHGGQCMISDSDGIKIVC